MTRSLVICLMLAVTTAMTAAGAALIAGWGLLAALGLYCLFGSTALVVAAFAVGALTARPAPAPGAAPMAEERAFA